MKSLRQLLTLFKKLVSPINEHNNRLILYNTALSCLGTDASPNDVAPDEFGCAETVNAIHSKAFGFPIGGQASTYWMYKALRESPLWERVDEPLEGDILISPTGYGRITVMPGHVGVMGESSTIMSNDSKTGLFTSNYTIKTWKERWVDKGKYTMNYFRRI